VKPAFTKGNRYLFDPKAWSWNLPSGWSCPAAEACLAKVDKDSGKMWNGPKQQFKCYSAMTERYPSVRARLWCNFDAVKNKSVAEIVKVLECMPKSAKRVRIHSAGDFFSQTYFDAWLAFVAEHPDVHFWAFTKSVNLWVNRLGSIPANLELQASIGGRHDALVHQHGLKYARVVWSQEEADGLGLKIDTDDYLAAYGKEPFALMENFTKKKKN
jgi:hypothetical protein